MPKRTTCLVLFTLLGCPGPRSELGPDGHDTDDASNVADAAGESVVVPTIEHSGCWTIETVPAPGATAVSFALDDADRAHLAYHENGEAIYARAVANGYARTVIGNIDSAFSTQTTLAVGRDGTAHVHYYMAIGATASDQLGHVYATNAGGHFIVTPLRDWYAKTIQTVAMTVDDAAVHLLVSASDYSTSGAHDYDNEIAYLECVGGSCTSPAVLFSENAVTDVGDLALARVGGRLAGLWRTASTSSFLYRSDVTTGSATETVVSGGQVRGSLAGNATEAVVAFATETDTLFADHLQAATNRSGAWEIQDISIDPVPFSIDATSVAVDAAGKIHIAVLADDLMYATNATGAWVVSRVAASDGTPTLHIDSGGHVHIAWAGPGGARHAVCSD